MASTEDQNELILGKGNRAGTETALIGVGDRDGRFRGDFILRVFQDDRVFSTITGLRAEVRDGRGIEARSTSNDGVAGESDAEGKSGVFGFNTSSHGLAFGVSGNVSSALGAGINGFSGLGIGVKGTSTSNDGVFGLSHAALQSGVVGLNTNVGISFGVSGISSGGSGVVVRGQSDAEVGVYGENTSSNGTNGIGVKGDSLNGIGGSFFGGLAPLRLQPSTKPGPPTGGNHRTGELFVDSNGHLFFCGADGTPGTWFRVALTPA